MVQKVCWLNHFMFKILTGMFFLSVATQIYGFEERVVYVDTAADLVDYGTTLVAESLDELVIKGIQHINIHGEQFEARAGSGQQAYNVSYILLNPRNRLHMIRQPRSITYFCRELLAYFKGSLNINDGLAQASSVWKKLADKNGKIASNYGYYVFHQKVSGTDKTQYDWVIESLLKNLDSRKAFININQPVHKQADQKDFPCTIGLQFFIQKNHLCCIVSSRSTDVFTGLPYDMGFFSFVAELVYQDLKERLSKEKSQDLKLGYVMMKATFTQIYDKTRKQALALISPDYVLLNNQEKLFLEMPDIENAKKTLEDIYNKTASTPVMKWIYDHAT